MSIHKSNWGEDNPEVMRTYNNIGMSLIEAGKYHEALEYLFRAKEGWSRLVGSKHPLIAAILTNVGIVYEKIGENQKDTR